MLNNESAPCPKCGKINEVKRQDVIPNLIHTEMAECRICGSYTVGSYLLNTKPVVSVNGKWERV